MLVKELRGRMRGARSFVVLTIYLLLLTCFASLIYSSTTTSSGAASGRTHLAVIGRALFFTIVLLEALMVAFITPAFTAGAISGERERRTYEVLKTTLLPPRSFVAGKLSAALLYVVLLILAAVPLQSLAFVLGGVVVEELIVTLVFLVVTALSFGTLGLFCSAVARTTLSSTVLAYAITLLVMFFNPIVALTAGQMLLALTFPALWLANAVEAATYALASLSPVGAATLTAITLESSGSLWVATGSHGSSLPAGWIVFCVGHLLLSLAMLAVTVRLVGRQESS